MNDIINWKNVFENSEVFKNNKPIPYGFVKNPFNTEFYDDLYRTYPEIDEKWKSPTSFERSAKKRHFGKGSSGNIIDEDDPSLSPSWNKLFHYVNSKEFAENMSKYTGLKIEKLRSFSFIKNGKGDFNSPHTHHPDVSPAQYEYKITILAYFAKGWKKGEPGGTYISENEDESSIIFEPSDLDNTWICIAETPQTWHGSRYIEKDVIRNSIQFTLN